MEAFVETSFVRISFIVRWSEETPKKKTFDTLHEAQEFCDVQTQGGEMKPTDLKILKKAFRCMMLAFVFIFFSNGRCLEFKNASFVETSYHENEVHLYLHNYFGILSPISAYLIYPTKIYLGWSNQLPVDYKKTGS